MSAVKDFRPNDLDNYSNVTYKIVLYMISEAKVKAKQYDIDEETIIIAETGVTGTINIDDLYIESFAGPGEFNRNISTSKITFSIREFMSVSLVDFMFLAAQELDIKNYLKAPYFIEVSFLGYNDDGTFADELVLKRLVYPIVITAIESNVTSAGAVYQVTAYQYNHVAQMQVFSRIPSALTIPDSTTAGDAIKKLEDILNTKAEQKDIEQYSLPDKFRIEIDPELAALKVVADETDVQNQRTATVDAETRNISINADVSVSEAINRIIASTPKYREFIKKMKNYNDDTVDERSVPKNLHYISTRTILLEYDNVRGDYQREFIYYVNKYDHGTLLTHPIDYRGTDGEVKLDGYIKTKRLAKKYDYIFTGLNDQVLNIDLKFNFAWFAAIPSQRGYYSTPESSSEGHLMDESVEGKIENSRNESQAESLKSSAKSSASNRAKSVAKDIQRLSSKIDQLSNSDTGLTASINLAKAKIKSKLGDILGNDMGESGSPQDYGTRRSNNFAESIDKAVTDGRPVTFYSVSDVNQPTNTIIGSEPDKGPGRKFVDSLFRQAFLGQIGDLLNIEIQVKGDTYWLGNPKQDDEPRIDTSREGDEDHVKTLDSQNYILFSLKTPSEVNPITGFMTPKDTVYSGAYAVRKIESRFVNGKFTQTLTCSIDTTIKMQDIGKYT